MNERLKIALVIIGVLLIPIVPFLLFSSQIEPAIDQWINGKSLDNQFVFSLAVIGLLVVDLVLPVPSSVTCTLAGSVLGTTVGTLVCWLGLSLSALLGYFLAAKFGLGIVRKLSSQEQIAQTQAIVQRHGPWGIVICRALPVLAEASVIFVGLYRLPISKFWPPVLLANLGISIAYCFLGDWAKEQGWLPAAFAVSIGIPLLILVAWSTRKNRTTG